MKRAITTAISLVLPAIFAGCCSGLSFKAKQHEVKYHDEAGEFTLAALPPIPWEEAFTSKLDPGFQMTGRDALNQVVPTTLKLEEAALELLRAKLKVALPTSGITETKTIKQTNGQASTVYSRTEELKPGDVAKAPDAESDASLPASGAGDAFKNASVAIDPMLKHQAAVALNQEVQILNAYLKHAVPAGYKAYVVRLQVGLVPYARNQPYDAYATFGFFPRGYTPPITATKGQRTPWAKLPPPIAVPLLVSDNLEGTLHARTIEQMRQFTLGIAAMLQGVGLEGEFENLVKRLERVFGTDFNSLLTVGQLAPNVIRVRFGAMNQPDARYAMVPRNNYVSVLMLIPEGSVEDYKERGIQIGMTTELRHSTTGVPLKPRRPDSITERLERIPQPIRPQLKQVSGMVETIEQNNLTAFVAKYGVKEEQAPYLWTFLSEFRLGSANRVAWFNLPDEKRPVLPPEKTAATLLHAADNAVLFLRGGTHMDNFKSLAASLVYKKSGASFAIPADQFVSTEGGAGLKASFPKIQGLLADADPVHFRVEGAGVARADYPVQQLTLPLPAPPAKPAYSVRGSAPLIVASADGKGVCEIAVDKVDAAAAETFLRIDGAAIARARAGGADLPLNNPKGLRLDSSAVITLDLFNLVDRSSVVLSGKDFEKVTLQVRSTEPASK